METNKRSGAIGKARETSKGKAKMDKQTIERVMQRSGGYCEISGALGNAVTKGKHIKLKVVCHRPAGWWLALVAGLGT